MRLSSLPSLLRAEPGLAGAVGRTSATLAVPEAARAIALATLAELVDGAPLVVAVPTTGEAERLVGDLEAFLGADRVDLFPAWETLPFERVSPSVEAMGRRLRTLWRLRHGRASVVVAPVRALVQRLGPHVEDVEPVVVRPGDQLDPVALVERLVSDGYRREYQVEHRGEVAVRGSIVDVYPSTADGPVRIDLWGDEVDRLTAFSVSDQRSRHDVDSVEVFACRELLPGKEVRARAAELVASQPWGREQWERLAEGQLFDGMESWLPWLVDGEHTLFDVVPVGSQITLVEPRRLRDRAVDLAAEEADLAASLARTWGVTTDGVVDLPRLHVALDQLLARTSAPALSMTSVAESPDTPALAASGWAPVVGDAGHLASRLRSLLADGYRVVLAADGEGSATRLAAALRDEGVELTVHTGDDHADLRASGGHAVVVPLERGFVLPGAKLAVLAERDVTGRRRSHRPARPRRRDAAGLFDDLRAGDYVVHVHHGVARYGGMVTHSMGGTASDYLLLEYRGGDKLYVPSDQIDAVRRYTGGESPTLHRMGGAEWQRAKAQARSATREIAQELVALYQRRAATPGHAFSPDTPWQRELEEAFPYKETPDQARAIDEVKADMEQPRPMDRLVCGDVGFGKTEIALRAAFKAVQDGMQVAVLVPTTLLAQQHAATFSERFAPYPVRVEVLSRFLTPAQARKVVQGVADGEVDVVIGTHRLLSSDVSFKRLGLLVVDEEQRFGVTSKEAIKGLKAEVDVLTLTATPIPRTLEMSLTGIRDLSLLHTPPAERQPILTYVGEHDERAIAEALRRELL
ncbi:MAG: DEAD/DEAH box helicase, partial [Actinomycetota bacterium]|nr:DEAD/DEAH box helicase [Actinomycetota bacterium]